MGTVGLSRLEAELAAIGMPDARLEIQDDLLVVHLPREGMDRLMRDTALRKAITETARQQGFARVVLAL